MMCEDNKWDEQKINKQKNYKYVYPWCKITHICDALTDGLRYVCSQQQSAQKFEDPRQNYGLPEGPMSSNTNSSSTSIHDGLDWGVWYAFSAVGCRCV